LLGPFSERRFLPDLRSTPERLSPTRRFSMSDRVSVPDRLSFPARLPTPNPFPPPPIVSSPPVAETHTGEPKSNLFCEATGLFCPLVAGFEVERGLFSVVLCFWVCSMFVLSDIFMSA
jgi:hypothetical protein